MICVAVRTHLSVQADGELLIDPALTADEVDQHVAVCASCQGFVESTRITRQMLRVGSVEAPSVVDDVIAALPQTSPRTRRLGQGVVAAAAIGAVFVGGSALQRSGGQFGELLADAPPTPIVEDLADLFIPVTTEPPLASVHVVWDSNLLTLADTERIASHEFVNKSAVAALSTVEIIATAEIEQATSVVEILSFDPQTYSEFFAGSDREAMSALTENEAVAGASAASDRGISTGSVLTLSNGVEVLVTAIVPDGVIAGADLALVDTTVGTLGAAIDPFVLIDATVEGAVVAETFADGDEGTLVVVERSANGSPRVAPKLYSSQRKVFETATSSGHDGIELEIVRSTVPLLGELECKAEVIRALTGAMNRLAARGLSALIDPDSTVVCFDPERTPETSGHWHHDDGVAIDINLNGDGNDPAAVDRRLIRVLSRFGFDWGGDFLLPQPSHFEFVASPKGDPPPPADIVAGDTAAG